MEYFALLKMLHGVAGVLLFVAFFALAGLCWRSRTRTVAEPEAGGETEMDAALAPVAQGLAPTDPAREAWEATAVEAPRPSPWPALCAVLLLLCLVGLPASGWWLAHLAARPLGQLWLLGSSLLFLPGSLCGLWLASRVAGRKPGVRLGLGLAVVGLLCFGASLGLMVAKPV